MLSIILLGFSLLAFSLATSLILAAAAVFVVGVTRSLFMTLNALNVHQPLVSLDDTVDHDQPIPVPSAPSVVKNGSMHRTRMSSDMPVPSPTVSQFLPALVQKLVQ
ncbi:MAG: hypothetical protein O2783_06940 [Chloroflexi bacterium]|nr:hypothetical protein [Chloroflexota bacterium]